MVYMLSSTVSHNQDNVKTEDKHKPDICLLCYTDQSNNAKAAGNFLQFPAARL